MILKEYIKDGIKIMEYSYEDSDYSTEEQRNAWKEICKTCKFNLLNKCESCNCLFESFMKLKDAKCPEFKW